MNLFETKFFSKYIPEWEEIKWVIHKHVSEICPILIFWLFWALIPSFLYYYSQRFQEFIPFIVLEISLLCIYSKLIYDIFDWYNDVWIITNEWIIDLKWSLFKKNINTVSYWNIEWIEVVQKWFVDSLLKRWSLVIHKIWDDKFTLKNTYKPFKHLDFIEIISEEADLWEDEDSTLERRFDTIINTLWWIMEWYMSKHFVHKNEELETKENIENIKEKEWTIDLR